MLTRRRFGQHFLEPQWADKLVDAIDPRPDDRFLEIGPGSGALTIRLAPRVAHLSAIEVDRDLVAALGPRLPANVALLQGDVLAMDVRPLLTGGPLRVAGNLPYNISSPIIFRLIDTHRQSMRAERRPAARRGAGAGDAASHAAADAALIDATLMVQREVAERIEAAPGTGEYGVLTISVQRYADVRRLLTLPPGAFRPPPRVHSAVIRLVFRPPAAIVRDERTFDAMVRALFTQRRKTAANALRAFAASRRRDARAALVAAGLDPGRRPETLQLAELARLADQFVEAAP